jgi:hypothetical protein
VIWDMAFKDVFPYLFGMHMQRILLLWLTWSFQVAPLSAVQALLESLIIERLMFLPLSLGCLILLE